MEYFTRLVENPVTCAQIGFEYGVWLRHKLETRKPLHAHKIVTRELKHFRNPYSEIPPKPKNKKHPLLNATIFHIYHFQESRKIKLRKEFWKEEITNTPEEAQWFRDYEYMQELIERYGEDCNPDDTYQTIREFRDLIIYCRNNDKRTIHYVPIMTLTTRTFAHMGKKLYLHSQINNL